MYIYIIRGITVWLFGAACLNGSSLLWVTVSAFLISDCERQVSEIVRISFMFDEHGIIFFLLFSMITDMIIE